MANVLESLQAAVDKAQMDMEMARKRLADAKLAEVQKAQVANNNQQVQQNNQQNNQQQQAVPKTQVHQQVVEQTQMGLGQNLGQGMAVTQGANANMANDISIVAKIHTLLRYANINPESPEVKPIVKKLSDETSKIKDPNKIADILKALDAAAANFEKNMGKKPDTKAALSDSASDATTVMRTIYSLLKEVAYTQDSAYDSDPEGEASVKQTLQDLKPHLAKLQEIMQSFAGANNNLSRQAGENPFAKKDDDKEEDKDEKEEKSESKEDKKEDKAEEKKDDKKPAPFEKKDDKKEPKSEEKKESPKHEKSEDKKEPSDDKSDEKGATKAIELIEKLLSQQAKEGPEMVAIKEALGKIKLFLGVETKDTVGVGEPKLLEGPKPMDMAKDMGLDQKDPNKTDIVKTGPAVPLPEKDGPKLGLEKNLHPIPKVKPTGPVLDMVKQLPVLEMAISGKKITLKKKAGWKWEGEDYTGEQEQEQIDAVRAGKFVLIQTDGVGNGMKEEYFDTLEAAQAAMAALTPVAQWPQAAEPGWGARIYAPDAGETPVAERKASLNQKASADAILQFVQGLVDNAPQIAQAAAQALGGIDTAIEAVKAWVAQNPGESILAMVPTMGTGTMAAGKAITWIEDKAKELLGTNASFAINDRVWTRSAGESYTIDDEPGRIIAISGDKAVVDWGGFPAEAPSQENLSDLVKAPADMNGEADLFKNPSIEEEVVMGMNAFTPTSMEVTKALSAISFADVLEQHLQAAAKEKPNYWEL